MNWRCVDCGRPSDTGGGTCECGSERFERATFQATKRCTECGELAAGRDISCPNCGFTSFEPLQDEEPRPDPSYHEWRCESCGKEYPKHTPPCDRCGGMEFERVHVGEVDVDEYVERVPWLTKRTIAVLALLVAAIVVLGLLL